MSGEKEWKNQMLDFSCHTADHNDTVIVFALPSHAWDSKWQTWVIWHILTEFVHSHKLILVDQNSLKFCNFSVHFSDVSTPQFKDSFCWHWSLTALLPLMSVNFLCAVTSQKMVICTLKMCISLSKIHTKMDHVFSHFQKMICCPGLPMEHCALHAQFLSIVLFCVVKQGICKKCTQKKISDSMEMHLLVVERSFRVQKIWLVLISLGVKCLVQTRVFLWFCALSTVLEDKDHCEMASGTAARSLQWPDHGNWSWLMTPTTKHIRLKVSIRNCFFLLMMWVVGDEQWLSRHEMNLTIFSWHQ